MQPSQGTSEDKGRFESAPILTVFSGTNVKNGDCNLPSFSASYRTVNRLGSNLVAALLLGTAVLWGFHAFLPFVASVSNGAASEIPARCHDHGQPARAPVSHQCCVAGHAAPMVQANTLAPSLRDFCSQVVTALDEGTRSQAPRFSASFSSGSPLKTLLRI